MRGEETSMDTTIMLSWIRLFLNLSPRGSQESKTQSYRGWNTHIYTYIQCHDITSKSLSGLNCTYGTTDWRCDSHWEVRCMAEPMLLKNIWHSEGFQLEDCVWTNRAKMRAPTTSQQLVRVCFSRERVQARGRNVFVCDLEWCPGILWDRWLEDALFPSLSVYLNSIFNTNILKEMKQLAADGWIRHM